MFIILILKINNDIKINHNNIMNNFKYFYKLNNKFIIFMI